MQMVERVPSDKEDCEH